MVKEFPVRLDYLIPTLSRFEELSKGVFRSAEARSKYLDTLTSDQLANLNQLYEEIVQRSDDITISRYLYGKEANGHAPRYVPLWDLVSIFESLSKRDIAPFNSNRLRIGNPPPGKLDWSIVPENLRYLTAAAEKHGSWRKTPEEVDAYLRTLSEQEREELNQIGRRFNNDRAELQKWIFRITEIQISDQARGHPPGAESFGEHEINRMASLRDLLSQGGFVPPRQGPRLNAQQLREMMERLEAEEAKQNKNAKE